jgi:triosephosphate isomerase
MRRALVAGNWKMNGTCAQATSLVTSILGYLERLPAADVVLCPPFVLIPLVGERLAGQRAIALGAQNLSHHRAGAYTGEVSGAMLRDHGCTYVIVGHSERRTLYGEDDDLVAAKIEAAVESGLTPILCVGETLVERDAGDTETIVARQINAVVQRCGIAALAKTVIAYEPVWAIGTGKTATPEQAQAVHGFIRRLIAAQDTALATGVRILYGGSVNAGNAAALFREPDIDGGLIGGASLQAQDFVRICHAAG